MDFFIFGHPNILGTHKNTFEFTKDTDLTKNGDCIIGIKADFSLDKISGLMCFDILKITISIDNITDCAYASLNKEFSDEQEIVFRLSDFNSSRTLGMRCDKAAKDLDRELIKKLKNPNAKALVSIEGVTE